MPSAGELSAAHGTRLHPPHVRRGHVVRPRLVRRLDDGAGRTLTLVSAPAGFGKTTLLADWASGRAAAWLTLDESDREATQLDRDVEAALAAAPQPATALVLDDCDRAVSPDATAWLARFVDSRPPALQVVLAGRSAPIPVAALRTHGRLLELDADDLRLTDLEAAALVRAELGHDLPTAQIELMTQRCEGWPAALFLSAAALAHGDPEAAELHLHELVVDEVLGERPDALRFLRRTSILDELSAPLCDAVLERTDSDAVLRALERDNLLVVPLDDTRSRYRLHGVARRLLHAELEPKLAATLHRRAAAWLRSAGADDEAFAHAVAAGDARVAGRLGARLAWTRDPLAVLAGVEQLPAAAADADLRTTLLRAWLLALDGRPAEAAAALDLARAHARAHPRLAALVRREAALVSASFAWDDVGAALARAALDGRNDVRACWALGVSLWWSGDDAAAEPWLRAAGDGQPLLTAAAARAVLSRISLQAGMRDQAERLAADAVATARAAGLEQLPALGLVATAAGAALAARGNHEAALPLLEQGVRLRRSWGGPLDTVDALAVAAPTAALVSGRAAAAELLAEARRVLATCTDAGVLPARLAAAEQAALPRPGRARHDSELSPRELAVLRLLTRGQSKREVAAELHVSFNTVHSHTKSIYRKLGVSSRVGAVARARELGIA